MFNHVFQKDAQLYKMVSRCPKIRKSIMNFVYRVINMIHSERYDPRTVKFAALSPAGENNKIVIMLQAAEYATAPIIEPTILSGDPSFALTKFVGSLYKALIENNGSVEGMMHCCPELSAFTFSVANRILEYYYQDAQRDLRSAMVWDCYDLWSTKDLMITSFIPK